MSVLGRALEKVLPFTYEQYVENVIVGKLIGLSNLTTFNLSLIHSNLAIGNSSGMFEMGVYVWTQK
jgi:hypothetical protein